MRGVVLATLATVIVLAHGLGVRNDDGHDHGESEWWEGGVFYQIYPRSFKDSDGDGVGDIKGITERLEHLKDLGVDGVWFSPLFKSPMADFGYDISDFRDVDPIFGTMADLEALIAKSKDIGVKVILDFVPNHTSDEHEWFVKAKQGDPKYRNYYVWREGRQVGMEYMPPNNWVAVFHTPAWTKLDGETQYYLHQFDKKQPDLNYRNPAVKTEMDDMIKFWLDKGVDGFRIDAINHAYEHPEFLDEAIIDESLPPSYENMYHNHTKDLDESYEVIYSWRELFDSYKAKDGHTRFMMTEAYASLEDLMKWFGTEQRRGSHMPFNFDFIMSINNGSLADDFKRLIDEWIAAMPSFGTPNWVLGNHDRARVASRYGRDRAAGLAIMEMTLPGIAVVYYGEEIGMEDNRDITWEDTQDPQACNTNRDVFQQHTRDPVRTPFQWDSTKWAGFSPANAVDTWLPVHPNYETINLAAQKEAPNSMFKLYQKLIQLRKGHTFRHGDLKTFVLTNNVFAFTRSLKDHETYAVAVNVNPFEVDLNLKALGDEVGKVKVVISSLDSDMKEGDEYDNVESLVLGRYDTVVFELMPSSGAVVHVSVLLLVVSVMRNIFA